MRFALLSSVAVLAFLAAGCRDDSVAPRDVTPPAAPRGLYSVTGDQQATLRWLANTEADVAGYRIYDATCFDCDYTRIGTTTGTSFVVNGLTNGVTRYFAVTAVDDWGNESELSYDEVFDTPRPAGYGATLANFVNGVAGAGWDFSSAITRASNDPATDIFFGYNGSIYQLFARDNMTDIQDMGYAASLDVIDWAPSQGWSPTGTVEAIPGHCYVVWTRDNNYAKLRVTGLSSNAVVFDWAYQTDPGNGELMVARSAGEGPLDRPITWLR